MQVKLRQQLLLDACLRVVCAEQESIGQHHGGASAFLQPVHDDAHEKVGGLGVGEVGGKMALDDGQLVAAVWRIHQDHVETVVVGVVQHVFHQAVVVQDVRLVHVVEQQIRDGQHIGKLLLLNAVGGAKPRLAVGGGFFLLLQFPQPTDDEPARTAGEIRHAFAELRRDHLRHEVGDGAGRVKFARASGGLQLLQDRFVNVAEGVDILVAGQVDSLDDVHDLPKQHAVFHILVRVLEDALDDALFRGHIGRDGKFLQRLEKLVHEGKQLVARQRVPSIVGFRPVPPAVFLGNDGSIAVVVTFPFFFLGVIDLEEQHPDDLLDALGVAVDAGIVPHDVPQFFDQTVQIAHSVSPVL